MQAREAKIGEEIDRLISALHRNASQQLRDNIHSFSRKLFSSGTGRPSSDSVLELREKVLVKVTNSHDQRAVLQCQDVTHRFLSNNALTRKPEVLRMLLKLNELANRQEEDIANVFRQVRKRQLNASLDTTLTQTIPQPRRTGQTMEQLKIIRNRGSVEQGISESQLVRQLSFTFTNTSSNEIIETIDGYQLRNSINVTDTVRRMIAELADLGWLHKKITKCAEKEGAVRKALRLAVNQELNEFYRWIGTMQNMAKEGRLSLRRLTVWAFYPESILKWLAIILEAVQPFDGCQVISIVNSYRPSGLAAINGLLNRILAYLLQPLLNYIHRWIYKGELLDTRGEFFIGQNRKVGESDEWQQRFKLLNQNIPNILNSESARMIFSAGKAIYFLINKCKVLYQVRTPFIDTRDLASLTAASSNSLVSPAFLGWLRTVHDQINSALVNTLFSQFHLKYHLQSMKHFFLCGKGDFIQHLYDNLKDKLSLKKQEVTEHSLDGYISDAILKCCADFKMPDGLANYRSAVADRLLAKKLETTGTEGWDCFNFQYSLQRIEPLRTILSPSVMMNYQKVFNFLWKVKQVQQTLKSLWIMQSRQQSLRMRKTHSKELHGIFHYVYLLRSAMSHFLTNLHSYLMVTIEATWNKFWEDIDAARSFDDILKKHREFQEQILDITLSTARDKNLQTSIANIFTVIGSFRVAYSRLMDNFDEYYEKRRLYEDRQAMARRGITVQALEIPEFNFNRSDKEIREVKSCFETTFKNLFLQIRKQGEGRLGCLNVLSAKLDFSQYYSNSLLE